MKFKLLITLIISVMILAACSSGQEDHSSQMTHDINSNDWSHFADMGVESATIEAYDFAVQHPEVLDYIPCYCGCYESAGHKDNTDCFVDQVDDNLAVLDNMGLGWGICVDIAREAKYEYEKGTDLNTIRKQIEEKYEKEGLEPTPTTFPTT